MTFDGDGSLIQMERRPVSAVSAAVLRPGHGGKLGKIESVSRGSVATVHETTITRNGLRHEFAFGPDGVRRAAD
jgi:hypothetical protein